MKYFLLLIVEQIRWLLRSRPAVAEYEGGLSRVDAERLTLGELLLFENNPATTKQDIAPEQVEVLMGIGARTLGQVAAQALSPGH